MTRVISFLSKKKDQMSEYKRIENEKFDKKIGDAKLKVSTLEAKKAKFNEEIDRAIQNAKD